MWKSKGSGKGNDRCPEGVGNLGSHAQRAKDTNRAYHARVRVFRLQDKARNPSVAAARTQGQKRAKRAGVCLSAREEHTILHGSNPRTNQTHSSPEHGWIDCGNQSDSSWMGKLLLQGTCPKTVRQVGSVDNAANLEPSHEAVAKQRLEIPTGTTALWRDGTGKLDSSHSFLTTEQMLTIVKAGCGKSARPVWEADGGQPRKVRLLRPDSEEAGEQTWATGCGGGGAKGEDRGEHGRATHAPDSEPGKRVPEA